MTYRVKGTLKLPDGSPAANCEIEFVSRKNLSPTVHGSKTNIKTSSTGYYDVTLELGEYAVIIYAGGTYPSQAGVIVVLADTTPGQDLPTLLSNGELLPTTPDYMQQIQAWLVAANEAADDSAASAAASEASSQAAAASAAATAAAVTAHEAKPSAHPISGVDGLQAALDGKEASGAAASAVGAHKIESGAHAISTITGLQSALDGKEAVGVAATKAAEAVAAHKAESNAHEIADITGLSDALASIGGGSGSGGGGFAGQHKNRVVNVSGIGYQGTITADRLCVETEFFSAKVLRSVNLSFDGALSGAGGLDTGVISAGNWYRIFVIYNQTTDSAAAILSLSLTSPVLPSGYTHYARVGAAYVATSATRFKPSRKAGNKVDYLPDGSGAIPNVLLNGVSASNTTAFSCATCVPPEASHIYGVSSASAGGYIYIIPSNNIYDCGRSLTSTGGLGVEAKYIYPLITPQTLFYVSSSASFRCSGYIEE